MFQSHTSPLFRTLSFVNVDVRIYEDSTYGVLAPSYGAVYCACWAARMAGLGALGPHVFHRGRMLFIEGGWFALAVSFDFS